MSETEEKTKEYDSIAFKYLYMVAVPLLLAYAAYSLVYESHKSWYSFVITTLVGSVYAYGFLMMVPSLYINYRLKVSLQVFLLLSEVLDLLIQCHLRSKAQHALTIKQSVAHMPARAMTYKFLNTFIDDLFAFTIKMPTLHRLATLRDDVIFFVYLYQSYAYKVDYSRVNEFGQGGEDEPVEEKVSGRPLTSPPDSKEGGKTQRALDIKKEEDKEEETVKAEKSSGADKGGAKKRK